MRIRSAVALLAVVTVAAIAAATVTRAVSHPPTTEGPASQAARTRFTGYVAATGEPTLPDLGALHPRPGSVARAAGPFDDRFTLQRLAFDGGHVRGSLRVTSDVSDLLDLEVLAGFYDRGGRLLGTARHVHHLDQSASGTDRHDGVPVETEDFTIAVPTALRGVAVSAAVGVPVLVNE